jgi:glycosyltransferase involved in cell wall biosynthesis
MEPSASSRRRADRLRVVTLVDFLSSYGGAERLALLIATRLDPECFESILCVSRWPSSHADPSAPQALKLLEETGVRLLPLRRQRKLDPVAWARLERFLRREPVHVLHSHKFGSNVWGTLVGRIAQVPVVIAHEHSWSYEGQALRRVLDRQLIARGADRFIAVSREDRRRMIEVEGIPAERTLFIPNGVPPPGPPSAADVRAELGIAANTPVIGSVGSLYPVKAFDVFLRAAASLLGEWPDLQVVIAGVGPERAALEDLAGALGLGTTLRLLGHRTDVPDVLRALDVAVCSSSSEGCPLSVIEYMQAGLPIVATAVGGIPDLLESGIHGLLVPPRDPQALATALAALLREPARARSMGARARQRQRAEFDIEVLVRRVEDLYRELLRERGRPPRGS